MYKSLIYIIILFLIQNYEPELAWSPDYRLQWSDFKGSPNMQSDAAATTASGITFGYRMSETDGEVTKFKAEVTAHFYPDKSWYKANEVNLHILEHEQLHFDITELHARKLRKQISELKVSNTVNVALEGVHKAILEELGTMQNAYDAACDYSRNKEQQQLWKETISNQLEALKAFAKTN